MAQAGYELMFYRIGRGLQLFGLLILPSAIWIAQFEHNEALAIGVLGGAVIIFYLGYFLARK